MERSKYPILVAVKSPLWIDDGRSIVRCHQFSAQTPQGVLLMSLQTERIKERNTRVAGEVIYAKV